jgi:hypothetical protein
LRQACLEVAQIVTQTVCCQIKNMILSVKKVAQNEQQPNQVTLIVRCELSSGCAQIYDVRLIEASSSLTELSKKSGKNEGSVKESYGKK